MGEAKLLKIRWSLEVAEQIERQFNLERTAFDVDKAAKMINAMLPQTWDEAIEEAEAWQKEDNNPSKVPTKPGYMERLRMACGFAPDDKNASLTMVLEAAIRTLNATGPYHVIEMPVDEHGRGPVRPEDADRTLWQVWDECNLTVCECTTKAHAERVARKLNAAKTAPEAWLPIATAPKDGSYIMLYSPQMGRRIGVWDWVCWVTDCGYEIKPTQWMPLLEPPALGIEVKS